jgi:hypothetical protein
MTDYGTVGVYMVRYGVTSLDKQQRLAEHLTAASRKVDGICHRSFGPSASATVRYFRPLSRDLVFIDDAYEISAVAVDDSDAGTYATAWASTDYETDPANGIGTDGQAGWPATALRSIGTRTFPTTNQRRAVKVTAKWGWLAWPDPVEEATYLFTARLAYEVGVPGGVLPPNIDFGLPATPLQRPYTAEGLLKPYIRSDRVIGVAG